MKEAVLIASSSFDEHAYGPVANILEQKGYPVVVYKTDKLLSGEDRFSIDLDQKDGPAIEYNGTSIRAEDLGAAWYRKIASFALPDADTQLAKQLHMNNEVRAFHDTIWPVFYPDNIWLNSPANLANADRKLSQLIVAREVGFSTPDTIVGSDWDAIGTKLLQTNDDQMIIKMMRGVISEGNQVKTLHTTPVKRQDVDILSNYTSPFPGIYQPYQEKAREWRVAVVGDRVFPTAIYTDTSAKDDWRKHQETSSVRFRDEKLPEGIDELCFRYLARFGLKFGAFDLVEKTSGNMVFLECNANGQYGWQEEHTDYPISHAIADELEKIASAY